MTDYPLFIRCLPTGSGQWACGSRSPHFADNQEGNVVTMFKLKRSYELVSESHGDKAEIRDTANQNRVVFAGTYTACVEYAKSIGIWYS